MLIIHPRMRKAMPAGRKGFTIVELLVYMGLMSIFILVLTNIFLSVLDNQTESEQTSSVEQDGRFILTRLNYDIARANSILSPASLGGSSSSATLVISGVNYTFAESGNNFLLTNDLGINQLNSYGSEVSNVIFTRLGNLGGKNSLQIKFRLSSVANRPAGKQVKDFQTTLGTR